MQKHMSLDAFIGRIAAEDFLPLPKQVPDDAWEDEDADWDDFETVEDAEKRIWSGKVAEILFRDYECFLEERAGPTAIRTSGTTSSIPSWFLYSEESPHVSPGSCVLLWMIGKPRGQRYFARNLSCDECEIFIKLRWQNGLTLFM